MDYIAILKADLEKGYSKADLEKLIGLPKNNLSGILKGDRRLSKKSELKIKEWEKHEKPNPLDLRNLNSNGRDNQFENAARGRDTNGVNNDEVKTQPNEQLITQYEEELTRLGTSQIAKERGKWLTKRIYELKYPKQND